MSLKIIPMKKIISIFVLCLLLINISAFGTSEANTNNYKCLDPLQTYYFSGEYNQVKCIRIDSVKLETDSVYYPFYTLCFVDSVKTINQTFYHNYSPGISSWIGKKMILKPNGDNIFINRFNDSITIKTTARTGEKWVMWQKNQIRIEATIDNIDTMSFLGLVDSVKSIRLQSVDKNNNLVNYLSADYTIRLSKKYGLIQTPSMYHFPFKINTQYDNSGTNNQLIGLSSPKAGFQNLTWKEVYDFEVGDEFHVHESFFYFGNGTENKIIHKIISKDVSDNIYTYQYLKKQLIRSRVDDNDEFTYTEDTITQSFSANSEFDKLPNEPQTNEYGKKILPQFGMSSITPDIKYLTLYDNLINRLDSLIWMDNLISDVGYYDYYEFRKGLGGPYYDYHPFMMMGDIFSRLVYYQKGNNSWGVPFDKLQNDDLNANTKIKIFVDRQNESIQIPGPRFEQGNLDIAIYDATGKQTANFQLESENNTISINDWPKGIYFYSVKSDSGRHFQGKLVIY